MVFNQSLFAFQCIGVFKNYLFMLHRVFIVACGLFSCIGWWLLFVAMHRLLIALQVASLSEAHGLQRASVVAARWL